MSKLKCSIDEEALINEVKGFPELWNIKLQVYKNNRNKEAAWIRISERMGYSIDELKQRWKSIRDKYVREKKAILTSQVSGSGYSQREPWEHFESMEFLKDTIKSRKSTSNMVAAAKPNSSIIPAEYHEEITMTTEFGDYILEESQDSQDLNKFKEREVFTDKDVIAVTNAIDGINYESQSQQAAASSQISTSANKRPNSDEVEPPYKKNKTPKKDGYEQTLIKMLKDNNDKIGKGCSSETVAVKGEDPVEMFLLSVKDDFKSLTSKNQRRAKQGILNLIDDLITEEEDAGLRN